MKKQIKIKIGDRVVLKDGSIGVIEDIDRGWNFDQIKIRGVEEIRPESFIIGINQRSVTHVFGKTFQLR